MPADNKKNKLHQELEFEALVRKHREPTIPVPAAEARIISDELREAMKREARFARVASDFIRALQDTPRRDAIKAEWAAIEAELDAEFGQTPERKKDLGTIPQRSLNPDPKARTADIKPPAAVEEIAKPAAATSENPTADPPASDILGPQIPGEKAETAADSESSTKKADPEQLLAQRRELKRRLKEGHSLNKREAAIYYGKSEKTIYNWTHKKNGPLKTVGKRGRITAASVLAFPPEDDLDLPV